MIKKKLTLLKQAAGVLLCAGLFLTQPGLAFAAENDAEYTEGTEAQAPTPTPDPHTEFYAQAPDTDAIQGWPQGPKIEAESAVLMELSTGSILYSKNADKAQFPASITKVMTALLACEHLDMNGNMVVAESAAYGIEPGSSSIYAETDEQFTIQQAMMAIMLESANEMSLAVAQETSGSVKKFVELMNRRAAQLGCTNTHFNNPNGLPDETHYTTANDMARIAKAAWSNLLFRGFVTTDYFEIPPTNKQPETRYMLNHHKMMAGRDYAYDGVVGGKTGYTDAAGNTLVTYAKRGNVTLLAVVLRSVNGAYPDTAALLDYGFNNFERAKISVQRNPVPVKRLPCEKYLLKNGGNTYPFYYRQRVYVMVPAGTDVNTLEKRLVFLKNAAGPDRLKTEYYYNGQMTGYGMQYEKEILSDLLL